MLGLTGAQGACLLTAPDDGVEVRWFPAELLGELVAQCVPPAAPDGVAVSLSVRVLPLAAVTGDEVLPGSELDAAQVQMGDLLTREARGMLRALVTGRVSSADSAGEREDALGAAQVMWVALPQGWVGLRPVLTAQGVSWSSSSMSSRQICLRGLRPTWRC